MPQIHQDLHLEPSLSMKPNQDFSTPYLKSMLSAEDAVEEETVIEDAEVGEDAEEVSQRHPRLHQDPDTVGPSIQTFQLETGVGVVCTSNMVVLHISVLNPPRVRGRIFTYRNLRNEDRTSPAPLKI